MEDEVLTTRPFWHTDVLLTIHDRCGLFPSLSRHTQLAVGLEQFDLGADLTRVDHRAAPGQSSVV